MQKTTSKKSPALSSRVGGNNSTYEPDPEKYKIASAIVYGSVIKRRNEQSVNWYMLTLGVCILIFLPYWWISSVIRRSELATIRREERQAEYNAIINEDGMTRIPIDGAIASVKTPLAMPTIAMPTIAANPIGVSPATPAPATPAPATPAPATIREIAVFAYSYYYPDLGGDNCHPANWDGSTCANTTASGAPWRDYLGRGVAIHASLLNLYPYGTIFKVISPANIAGEYTVIDLCAGCIRDDSPSIVWIDLLDTSQRLNWSTPILVEIIRP